MKNEENYSKVGSKSETDDVDGSNSFFGRINADKDDDNVILYAGIIVALTVFMLIMLIVLILYAYQSQKKRTKAAI